MSSSSSSSSSSRKQDEGCQKKKKDVDHQNSSSAVSPSSLRKRSLPSKSSVSRKHPPVVVDLTESPVLSKKKHSSAAAITSSGGSGSSFSSGSDNNSDQKLLQHVPSSSNSNKMNNTIDLTTTNNESSSSSADDDDREDHNEDTNAPTDNSNNIMDLGTAPVVVDRVVGATTTAVDGDEDEDDDTKPAAVSFQRRNQHRAGEPTMKKTKATPLYNRKQEEESEEDTDALFAALLQKQYDEEMEGVTVESGHDDLAKWLQEEEENAEREVMDRVAAELLHQQELEAAEKEQRKTNDADRATAELLHQQELEAAKMERQEAEAAMKTTIPGKAVSLVSKLIKLIEETSQQHPTHAKNVEAVSTDDMVFLAEKLLESQKDFNERGLPVHCDIGYHYTSEKSLKQIRTIGLLTKSERADSKVVAGRENGSVYGDGVYTANNPFAFNNFGPVGLIVVRLKGTVAIHNTRAIVNKDDTTTVRGNKITTALPTPQFNDEDVLQNSSQCLPLVKFSSSMIGKNGALMGLSMSVASKARKKSLTDPSIACVFDLHEGLQSIVDEYLNNGMETDVVMPDQGGNNMFSLSRNGTTHVQSTVAAAAAAAAASPTTSAYVASKATRRFKKRSAVVSKQKTGRKQPSPSLSRAFGATSSSSTVPNSGFITIPPGHPSLSGLPVVHALPVNPSLGLPLNQPPNILTVPNSGSTAVSAGNPPPAALPFAHASSVNPALGLALNQPPNTSTVSNLGLTSMPPGNPPPTASIFGNAVSVNASLGLVLNQPPNTSTLSNLGLAALSGLGPTATAAGNPPPTALPFVHASSANASLGLVLNQPSSIPAPSTSGSTTVVAPIGISSARNRKPPPARASSRRRAPRRRAQKCSQHVQEELSYVAPDSLSQPLSVASGLVRHVPIDVCRQANGSMDCPICQTEMTSDITATSCKHYFDHDCLLEALKFKPQCPVCRLPVGETQGKCPSGTMKIVIVRKRCQGISSTSVIQINYTIPSGIQKNYHESPGSRFHGATRTAYLLDDDESQALLKRLKYAFLHGLTFIVGTSLTTGQKNIITWSSIHHKTSVGGGPHSLPDPSFVANCNEELDNLHVPPANECG